MLGQCCSASFVQHRVVQKGYAGAAFIQSMEAKTIEKKSRRVEEFLAPSASISIVPMRLRSHTGEDLRHESNASKDVLLSLEVRSLLKYILSGNWLHVSHTSLITAIWTIHSDSKGIGSTMPTSSSSSSWKESIKKPANQTVPLALYRVVHSSIW